MVALPFFQESSAPKKASHMHKLYHQFPGFLIFFCFGLRLATRALRSPEGGDEIFLCVGRLEKKLGVKRAKNLKMDTTNFSRSALSLR